MKPIRLAYAPIYNAGDLLNVDLVEKLSGRKVVCSKVYNADMTAIGGALFGAQYSDGFKRRMAQKILGATVGAKPLYVWGSGFYHDYNANSLYRKNLKICALRGMKTRERLRALTGVDYDVPLADAGFLIDLFLDEKVEKRYKIGLIPHHSQRGDDVMKRMAADPDVYFIDIKRTPAEVVKDIAACECIASSSLHGLIFADALHIPSLHILGQTELAAGNFKFEDYYSCFGLEDKPWVMDDDYPRAKDIIDSYRIDPDEVEKKKQQLIDVFPKF